MHRRVFELLPALKWLREIALTPPHSSNVLLCVVEFFFFTGWKLLLLLFSFERRGSRTVKSEEMEAWKDIIIIMEFGPGSHRGYAYGFDASIVLITVYLNMYVRISAFSPRRGAALETREREKGSCYPFLLVEINSISVYLSIDMLLVFQEGKKKEKRVIDEHHHWWREGERRLDSAALTFFLKITLFLGLYDNAATCLGLHRLPSVFCTNRLFV